MRDPLLAFPYSFVLTFSGQSLEEVTDVICLVGHFTMGVPRSMRMHYVVYGCRVVVQCWQDVCCKEERACQPRLAFEWGSLRDKPRQHPAQASTVPCHELVRGYHSLWAIITPPGRLVPTTFLNTVPFPLGYLSHPGRPRRGRRKHHPNGGGEAVTRRCQRLRLWRGGGCRGRRAGAKPPGSRRRPS